MPRLPTLTSDRAVWGVVRCRNPAHAPAPGDCPSSLLPPFRPHALWLEGHFLTGVPQCLSLAGNFRGSPLPSGQISFPDLTLPSLLPHLPQPLSGNFPVLLTLPFSPHRRAFACAAPSSTWRTLTQSCRCLSCVPSRGCSSLQLGRVLLPGVPHCPHGPPCFLEDGDWPASVCGLIHQWDWARGQDRPGVGPSSSPTQGCEAEEWCWPPTHTFSWLPGPQ